MKFSARSLLKQNYWRILLVSLLLTVCTGAMTGSAGSRGASDAKNAFSQEAVDIFGSYGLLILMIVSILVSLMMIMSILLKIFLLNPLDVSCRHFYIKNHYAPASLTELSYVFNKYYLRTVKTLFLRDLYTALWSLLLVIPGIVKSYEYKMIPYLLASNPEMSTRTVFAESRRLMMGNKAPAFVLDLSFIGWDFLNLFTLGVLGLFYISPYKKLTACELYIALTETEIPAVNITPQL